MNPILITSIIITYFSALFFISYFTGKKNDNDSFFKANKNSPWYLVAFGMIGTALSGVTFISVPGEVGAAAGQQFKYFQFVLGNGIGFIIVATVLLPLYYKLNLTSIYTYIEKRIGFYSYKTASSIFLISRTIGSAFRLYLVVIVLQHYVFDFFNIPFAITVLLSLGLIFAYTYKGGLKTIIITDTLQTLFLVGSVFFTIYFICKSLDLNFITAFETVKNSQYSKIFFFDNFMENKFHFVKQILGGIFVTITMVGLDQDLMQKNLSCKNIQEAQKNMFVFTGIFIIVNLFFLSVGALLYLYANKHHIAIPTEMVNGQLITRTDYLFPEIAFNHFTIVPAIIFLLGLTAATFATTDSALTALTTAFCIDFLNMEKNTETSKTTRTRHWVHLGFSVLMFLVILLFKYLNNQSVVTMIFIFASYTYGPLLGLFGFGLLFKNRKTIDSLVPYIAIFSPIATYVFNKYAPVLLNNYVFDNELIIVNGLITLTSLYIFSKKEKLTTTIHG